MIEVCYVYGPGFSKSVTRLWATMIEAMAYYRAMETIYGEDNVWGIAANVAGGNHPLDGM